MQEITLRDNVDVVRHTLADVFLHPAEDTITLYDVASCYIGKFCYLLIFILL